MAVTRYAIQEHIQIEKYVNEPGRVRVRCCKESCPWLLCASKDKTSGDFIVKTYNPIHKCLTSTHNYLCNSKFLATKYKERITQQPNISIVLLQDIIRKELDINVGRTTVRRARTRVLQEIMGDHIMEYGRIFDYRDEILRSNPGSTCVVKVGEDSETGQKFFEGFYVCFNALKKAFFGGARRLIGFDGCFLKGVCKGQLLVAVCRDGNNQMLPIAWAVVEVENQYTWTWFLELVKNDLEIGEGHQLSIISDMQKVITDIHLTILLLLSFSLKLILFMLCWFVRD